MDLPESVLLQEIIPILGYDYSKIKVFLSDKRYAYMIHQHLSTLLFDDYVPRLALFKNLIALNLHLYGEMDLSNLQTVETLNIIGSNERFAIYAKSDNMLSYVEIPPHLVKFTTYSIAEISGKIFFGSDSLTQIQTNAPHISSDDPFTFPSTVTCLNVPNMFPTHGDLTSDLDNLRSITIGRLYPKSSYASLEYLDVSEQVDLTVLPPKLKTITMLKRVDSNTVFPVGLTDIDVYESDLPMSAYPDTLTSLVIYWYNHDSVDDIPCNLTKLHVPTTIGNTLPNSVTDLSIVELEFVKNLPPGLTRLTTQTKLAQGQKFPTSLTKLETEVLWTEDFAYLVNLKELSIVVGAFNVILPDGLKLLSTGSRLDQPLPPNLLGYTTLTATPFLQEMPRTLIYCNVSRMVVNDYVMDKLPPGILFLKAERVALTDWNKFPKKLVYACFAIDDVSSIDGMITDLKYNYITDKNSPEARYYIPPTFALNRMFPDI